MSHISRSDNEVADALSRLDIISMPVVVGTTELAEEQSKDPELTQILHSTVLQIKKLKIDNTNETIFCDISTEIIRPYIPVVLRKKIFDSVHNFAHPSGRVTRHLIAKRFVWPGMNKDILLWARNCVSCQRSKINRHVKNPPSHITVPERFQHIYIDIIGPLPTVNNYRYCLTMIDRFSRWRSR